MAKKIELGSKVKDIVSGFVGIAIVRLEYLNGCVRYTVQAKQNKEDDVPTMDIDIEQLEVIGMGILKKKKVTKTGGSKDFKVRNSIKLN